MDLPLPEQVSHQEALRYLGPSGWQPDEATRSLLQKAEALLRAEAQPRAVWRQVPPEALPLAEAGQDLARHLNGWHAVLLMAATLGSRTDGLLRRLELTDIALAAAADAMAAVFLEGVCDELQARLEQDYRRRALYLTTRYAPGYGDCPLSLNEDVCLLLDTVRGCGLAVTPQQLLTPRKSTTAIVGVADHPVTGARAGCANCLLKETCVYRKRGKTCAD